MNRPSTRVSARRRLLFVCSQNRWRSPTAERVFRPDARLDVRSAGTNERAARKLREQDLRWAELVLVMEERHKKRIAQRFPNAARQVRVEVLGIPDDYRFMDPELVALLEEGVGPLVEAWLIDTSESSEASEPSEASGPGAAGGED